MDRKLTRDGEVVRLDDGVVVQNNAWGRGNLVNGRDYVQTVACGDALADGVRMDWAWPAASPGIRAYPQLLVGRKPWGPDAGGDLLPLRISEAHGLAARFDLAWGGETEGFNVAFDLWITDRPDGGPEAISAELMVWLKRGDFAPAGQKTAQVQVLGQDAPVHMREDHGGGWTYLAVVPDRAAPHGEIDLGALVAQLQAEGLLRPDHWIVSVELGAEVKHGEGWLAIRDFAVARSGHAAAGTEGATALVLAPDPQPPLTLSFVDLAF